MQVDGGANIHICTNKQLFYKYHSINSSVQQVTGLTATSVGIGIMIIRLIGTDIIIPLYPVYHMTQNPQHTLGCPAIKHYNKFRAVKTSTLESVTFITSSGNKHVVQTNREKSYKENIRLYQCRSHQPSTLI